MGLGIRVFFVGNDNTLKQISLRRLDKLMRNDDDANLLFEYAGQRVRYALVVLELENRKPTAIRRIDCSILKFDPEGRIDQEELYRHDYLAVSSIDSPSPMFGPHIESP